MRETKLEATFQADGMVLQAFMLQVAVELCRDKPQPLSWARAFVDRMYAWIANSDVSRDTGTGLDPASDLALASMERLERDLTILLADRRRNILD